MQIHSGDLPALEQNVRSRLASSLESLWQHAGEALPADPSARAGLTSSIRAHRQHPRVFARYYDLALALMDSRLADARRINEGLLALPAEPLRAGIRPFSHQELGEDFERFSRLLFAEEGLERPLAAPSATQFETISRYLDEAQTLIAEVDPDLAREVALLWPMIFLARPEQVGRVPFAGVTSFMVWGAGFMNVEAFNSPTVVAGFLVHETTHSLLFALGCDEALVQNPLSESFQAPFRPDPRPMDGIYHATIVSARMFHFRARCLQHLAGDSGLRAELEQRLEATRDAYSRGRKVIAEHGRLSARALALLEDCDRILAAAA